MHVYDFTFADGKSCRVIDPNPGDDPAESLRGFQAIFKPGYLVDMTRIIAPPPERLPWIRQSNTVWTCALFVLERLEAGVLRCTWPGGEVVGDRDEVSAAVRINWLAGN